jgi:hypothetical protein
VEHPPHAQRAAAPAARRSATSLRVLLATARLVVLSALGLLGAILALLPVALEGGPSGRRVARLTPAAGSPPAEGAGGEDFLDRRVGEAGRR